MDKMSEEQNISNNDFVVPLLHRRITHAVFNKYIYFYIRLIRDMNTGDSVLFA